MNNPKDIIDFSTQEKRRLLEDFLRPKKDVGNDPQKILSQQFQFPEEYVALKERFGQLDQYGKIYFNPSQGINNNLTVIDGRQLINFSGYNYLGMSGDPVVSQAAREAIDRYGTSVSASRIASGQRPLHEELEAEITQLLATEDCIVFVGGYGTNESTIGHLCGSKDLILYDSLIHASVQAGARLSGSTVRPFPHNSWEALDEILKERRSSYRQVLIVIEGVYSMDGDIPNLPKFIEIKKRHQALLMIDEAHSIGVLGEHGAGIGEYYNVNRTDVDLWMGTLSKSFASCGGYIAAQRKVVEYLKYTVPGFVYSVGMSPPNAAAALTAIRQMKREPKRLAQLRSRAQLFLERAQNLGLNTGTSKDSPVIPIILGQSLHCVELYKALYDRGILAIPVMYPAVPESASRLRFFITCLHTEEQIGTAIDTIAESMPHISSK